jgi:hypothetical protein
MTMTVLSPLVARLLSECIEQLQQTQACAGCNDLEVPNTPEMKDIWAQYNKWNSGATSPADDQWIPFPDSTKATVVVSDSVLIFLLKKHLGLST